jgi:pimeloyl-ACP methyl ester carboxylesterase
MTLSHDVAGDGPVLVLLHSGVCDRRMWDAQWPALIDAGYRLVRCDLRGFGETPAPDRPHNDAEDVLDLLDGLGIARAALVGSSYGGQVALETAARRPDRVGAIALICSALPGHEPSAELRALGAREEALIEAGDVAGATELMVENWLGPDADETAREAVRQMQRHAFEVQLAATEEFEPIKAVVDLAAIDRRPTAAAARERPPRRAAVGRPPSQPGAAVGRHRSAAGLSQGERPGRLRPEETSAEARRKKVPRSQRSEAPCLRLREPAGPTC